MAFYLRNVVILAAGMLFLSTAISRANDSSTGFVSNTSSKSDTLVLPSVPDPKDALINRNSTNTSSADTNASAGVSSSPADTSTKSVSNSSDTSVSTKDSSDSSNAPKISTTTNIIKGGSSTVRANDIGLSTASSFALAANVQAASVQVEPTSGSANLNIPIAVPPGRAGIQPNLSFAYTSSNRQLGNAGVGWNLDLGAIQVSTQKGIPKYDGTDIFTMEQNGSTQDLVADPNTSGLYHMEVEGAFAKIQNFTTYWVITDKKGINYYYGNYNGSVGNIQNDPTNPTHIFRWALSRVEDLNGNYMTISYLNDQGQLYPQTINYTGNDQSATLLNTYAQININYEAATQGVNSFISGFSVTTAQRIKQITVMALGNTQSIYNFAYSQSQISGRDLLHSVTQNGMDGNGSLPPVTFTYQDAPLTFTTNTIVNPAQGDNLWNYRFAGGYDRGHDNYGPVPGFDVTLGPTYTQSSGSWSGGSWSIDSQGDLAFQGAQDQANMFWTFLYVRTAKTIHVPVTGGDVLGVYINNDFTHSYVQDWPLQAGWNVVMLTVYNQNQGINMNLNCELAQQVDVMNSTQMNLQKLAADFNNDGYADIGFFNPSVGTFTVALGKGTSFGPYSTWFSGISNTNQTPLYGDFNADGLIDLAIYDSSAHTVRVALSNGQQFKDNGIWLSNIPAGATVTSGSFMGDGYTDLFIVYPDTSGWAVEIAKGNGSSFQVLNTYHNINLGSSSATIMAADFNGDGLTDLVGYDKSSGTWNVVLNANGFSNANSYSLSGFSANNAPVLVDVNNDGLTDIGYIDNTNGNFYYYPSIVGGFGPQTQANFQFLTLGADTEVQTADFMGLGVPGFMAASSSGRVDITTSNGTQPIDLLVNVDNGVGASTSILYDSNFHYPNNNMPYFMSVIKSTSTTVDGQTYTTRYNYSGALWDTNYREFDGFKTGTVTDANNNYVTTSYLQDHWLKGHPVEVDTYASGTGALPQPPVVTDSITSKINLSAPSSVVGGILYSKIVNQWKALTILTNSKFSVGNSSQKSKFPYILRTDNYLYDGQASFKRTAQEFRYDETPQYGDVTEVINDGQVDPNKGVSMDPNKTTTITSYVNNTNNWLIGLPSSTVTTDTNNHQISKVSFFYDGDNTGTAVPSLGRLTAKINWLGSSTQPDPKTTYTYDAFGNLQTTIDPNNNETTITYDNTVHLFPVETSNALDQTVNMTYYGIDGVSQDSSQGYHGLWGQEASTTDANDQTSYTIYDVFGRKTATVSPLDSVALSTQLRSYNIQPSYIEITDTARIKSGTSQTISSTSFYDGLGRLIESKSLGQTTGQYLASGQTIYDTRGLPTTKYLSYFTSNDLDTIDPIDTTKPAVSQTYDPMGRVITKTNPDGTYSSMAYNQWTSTSTDENGHQRVSMVDAFGRLVLEQEYMGADGRCANYPASPYTLYASTQYTYNPSGELIKVTDAHNNVTTVSYDNLGRKIAMNDPDMGYWQYGYDNNSNLIWQKDSKGQVISFTYDALNRLVNKTDGLTNQAPTFNVTYNYDDESQEFGIGRLGSINYDNGQVSFIYDELGREISSTKNIALTDYTVSRQYDDLNRLLQLQYPDNDQAIYGYNQAGQIMSVSNQ